MKIEVLLKGILLLLEQEENALNALSFDFLKNKIFILFK